MPVGFMILLPFFIIHAASAEVLVENEQHYIRDDGRMYIIGEIYNDLDYAINQMSVEATVYSDHGEILEVTRGDSLVRTLPPSMKAPFEVVLEENSTGEMDRYVLSADYRISAPKSQVIEITDSEMKRSILDNTFISGTVVNNGHITANTVSVVATLYDRDGSVLAVSRMHTEPDYLKSDDVAHFVIPITDKVQAGSAVDYSLVAESEEYAAVPEFPIGTSLLLAGSVGAYVLMTRVSGRLTAGIISVADPR